MYLAVCDNDKNTVYYGLYWPKLKYTFNWLKKIRRSNLDEVNIQENYTFGFYDLFRFIQFIQLI